VYEGDDDDDDDDDTDGASPVPQEYKEMDIDTIINGKVCVHKHAHNFDLSACR